jgi:hypothetical protein
MSTIGQALACGGPPTQQHELRETLEDPNKFVAHQGIEESIIKFNGNENKGSPRMIIQAKTPVLGGGQLLRSKEGGKDVRENAKRSLQTINLN